MSQKAIPIIDFDALITAINALSAPSATDVAVSNTNMHYITEDDAQGALAELDAECYALNNSLAQKQDKIVTTHFSGTTDSAGNIKLQGVSTTNHIILAVVSTSGYCTQCAVSGTDYYVKVLGNTSPLTPVANANTVIYFTYIEA